MSKQPDDADLVPLLIEQQGLERAAKLFPDSIKAAAERGLRPLGAFPPGTPPRIQPAGVFDPVRFEPRE
jgi:hypothetical protein